MHKEIETTLSSTSVTILRFSRPLPSLSVNMALYPSNASSRSSAFFSLGCSQDSDRTAFIRGERKVKPKPVRLLPGNAFEQSSCSSRVKTPAPSSFPPTFSLVTAFNTSGRTKPHCSHLLSTPVWSRAQQLHKAALGVF